MILHTLNALPGSSVFGDCTGLARSDDAIVLMGDGVYAAIEGAVALQQLLSTGAELYLLEADARAAGLATSVAAVTPLDMDGLVALSEKFSRQLAWY